LTALLRSARLALVMMRFFWLLMFATLDKASGELVCPQLPQGSASLRAVE
jgi:hypothetical protein